MGFLIKLAIKLATVALAGYGAWVLYDRYGDRAGRLAGPAQEFSDRVTTATHKAVDTLSDSGAQAAGALKDAANEAQRAAKDAADAAGRELASPTDTASNGSD